MHSSCLNHGLKMIPENKRMQAQFTPPGLSGFLTEISDIRRAVKTCIRNPGVRSHGERMRIWDFLHDAGVRVFSLHVVDGKFGGSLDVVREIVGRAEHLKTFWQFSRGDHVHLRKVDKFLTELPDLVDRAINGPSTEPPAPELNHLAPAAHELGR